MFIRPFAYWLYASSDCVAATITSVDTVPAIVPDSVSVTLSPLLATDVIVALPRRVAPVASRTAMYMPGYSQRPP